MMMRLPYILFLFGFLFQRSPHAIIHFFNIWKRKIEAKEAENIIWNEDVNNIYLNGMRIEQTESHKAGVVKGNG